MSLLTNLYAIKFIYLIVFLSIIYNIDYYFFFFFQAEDGIRDIGVTGVQTCALPICNVSLVHFTKTLAVQLGRYGITVNCIHPGTTRTERTPSLLAARAAELGVPPEEVERRDFAHGSPRGNAIGRMVDAAEIAYLTAFLASDKAWAITGELIVANGGAG